MVIRQRLKKILTDNGFAARVKPINPSWDNAYDSLFELTYQICKRYCLTRISAKELLEQLRTLNQGGFLWIVNKEPPLLSDLQTANATGGISRFQTKPRLKKLLTALNDPNHANSVFCPILEQPPTNNFTKHPQGSQIDDRRRFGTQLFIPRILWHLESAADRNEPDGLLFLCDHLAQLLQHWHQPPVDGESLLSRFARLEPHFQHLISPHPCFDVEYYIEKRQSLANLSQTSQVHPIIHYLRNCERSQRFRSIQPISWFNPCLWMVQEQNHHYPQRSGLKAPLTSFLTSMDTSSSSCPISFQWVAGRVEGLDNQAVLRGWCQPTEPGKQLELEVWLAGIRLGEGIAQEDRPDLARKGLAMGACGFAINLNLDVLQLELLANLKDQRWSIVSIDQRFCLGQGDWRLTAKDRSVIMDHLLLHSLANEDLEPVKAWLSNETDFLLVAPARYRIVEWTATSAMAGSWDTKAVDIAHKATLANTTLQRGVEADCCSRVELLMLAIAELQRYWDVDQLHQSAALGSEISTSDCQALADQLTERCYYGPSAQERHYWNSHLRPLCNVVIATLLLQEAPPDINPSRPLLESLIRLCQEVYGDLAQASMIMSLLAPGQTSATQTDLRLRLRSGDAMTVAISLFHQRRTESKTNLSEFDQARALLVISRPSLITIEAALRKLLPLIPAQQARTPRVSFSRRLLDQLGWHVNTLSFGLINQLIELGLPQELGLAIRERSIAILASVSEAMWCGDNSHSGCTSFPHANHAPRRWLLIGERSLPQCWLYRVEQKCQQLERCGAEVRCIDKGELDEWTSTHNIAWADAVLFCRTPATYGVIRAFSFAQHLGKQVFADVDDLVFSSHFPAPLSSYGGTISRTVHRRLALDAPLQRFPLEHADRVFTSTAALADACRESSDALAAKLITILPNLPLPELQNMATRLANDQHEQRPQRLVVSSGTLAHKQIWKEQLAPAIAELLGNHADLRLTLIGHLSLPPCLQAFSARVNTYSYTDYSHYLQIIAKGTIALVALESHPTTHCKSAIKWMEASLLGLTTICSPVQAYTNAGTPEDHLLVAEDQQAWVRQVERLLNDPQLQKHISSQARQHAQALFQNELSDQTWRGLLKAKSGTIAQKTVQRKKLLVINVFFAPQSIGGATRVTQDQVRKILNQQDNSVDVTVLCAENDPWQISHEIQTPKGESQNQIKLDSEDEVSPPPIDIWNWHGARIVRLGIPPRPWADIQDKSVERFCRQWFQEESFDLIHCHCCQVLTASPLVVAREQGIPYQITLHDAWWLSPELFLVSPGGRAINSADPFDHIDGSPTAKEKAVALERRSILGQILQHAYKRLAVSDAFRNVYEQAGVKTVEVEQNQHTPMPPPMPRQRIHPDNPIRICHIGGMAMHKGYPVLRQAAHLLPPNLNLVFTVVDHHLQEDEPAYTSTWSTYPVHFIPPVRMEEMAIFYATQDVLVAPSIWPESFGLATREALSAGLYVIASNIGALAEPIKTDLHGIKLTPGSVDELTAALSNIRNSADSRFGIQTSPEA